jgi:hypothetical protein
MIYLTFIFLGITIAVSLLAYGLCLVAKRSDQDQPGYWMDAVDWPFPDRYKEES